MKNVVYLLHQIIKMETSKMTIRQIRQKLSSTGQYAVIGSEELNNEKSRDYLDTFENQEAELNVIDECTHLLIYGTCLS